MSSATLLSPFVRSLAFSLSAYSLVAYTLHLLGLPEVRNKAVRGSKTYPTPNLRTTLWTMGMSLSLTL